MVSLVQQMLMLVLVSSYLSGVMCDKTKFDGKEGDSQETSLITTMPAVSSKSSRALARVKREPPAPTVAYYDFLVNEFSFKVWAVFEVVTIALLFYSTFAAIYYARWTYLRSDFTEDDLSLIRRSQFDDRLMRALETPPG